MRSVLLAVALAFVSTACLDDTSVEVPQDELALNGTGELGDDDVAATGHAHRTSPTTTAMFVALRGSDLVQELSVNTSVQPFARTIVRTLPAAQIPAVQTQVMECMGCHGQSGPGIHF